MNSMPNRLSDLQFQQVGNYVRVFNPHNGRRYKLPLKQALLLLSLDGESWRAWDGFVFVSLSNWA